MSVRQITAGYATVDGGRLYYEVVGDGHPLVLIHAGVADLRMWDPQVPAFSERYRVIRYDERFAGRSSTQEVAFSRRKDLADLLDHLGTDRAYVLGCSRGGQLAIDFTLDHRDRVDALIPVAPGVSGLESEPSESERAVWDEAERLFEAKDWEKLVDLEVALWVDGPGQPTDRVDRSVREKVHEMQLANYRNHQENLDDKSKQLEPPAVGRLPEISVPTLAVVGDLDVPGVRAAVDKLAAEIPGARKEVIAGTAHMLNMEQPTEFNRLVLSFLDSL